MVGSVGGWVVPVVSCVLSVLVGMLLRVTLWWMNWLCRVLLLPVALVDDDGLGAAVAGRVSTL